MNKYFKIFIITMAQTFVIMAAVYVFLFPISIRGDSMQTTLYDGDRVLASRFMGRLGFYDTGAIVIFREVVNNKQRTMVKRVIAMENDEVVISGGRVYVNKVPVPEEYISGYTEGSLTITVPKNCIFVMGDNREESFDSRQYGSVEMQRVNAKVIAKIYPVRDFELYIKHE